MNQNLPQWQSLTGLYPDAEATMSPEQRDEKIRILLADVERRARLELDRAAHCPAGERTVYWDPVEAACQDLGISRVRLSAYSRRLRGMRALEIGDKLKAATLQSKLEAWIAHDFKLWMEILGARYAVRDPMRIHDVERKLSRDFSAHLKFKKNRDAANRFAMNFGFPNITRLRKACVLAFETTLDCLIHRIASNIVQKYTEQKLKALILAAKAAEKDQKPAPAPATLPASPALHDADGEAFDLDKPVEYVHVPHYSDAEIEQMEKEEEVRMLRGQNAA